MNKILVPDTYPTLEEACENAAEGDVITIKQGNYTLVNTIEISCSITLCGETDRPEDVVIDCLNFQTFRITGGSPSFQNLTVINGLEDFEEGGMDFHVGEEEGEQDGGETEEYWKDESYDYKGEGYVYEDSNNDAPCCFMITDGTPRLSRCVIISHKGNGISIKGKESNPTVEKCTIKDCSCSGVLVDQEGSGVFKNLDISGNGFSGIEVIQSGNPLFIECKIHDEKGAGILVYKEGLGEFLKCNIYKTKGPGIDVTTSGNPTFTECNIGKGNPAGVFVRDGGLGTFKKCNISRNKRIGVAIVHLANPTFIRCKIHNGKETGVYICSEGLGIFKECKIYDVSLVGVYVVESGNPTFIRCKIYGGDGPGLYIVENGFGVFRNCQIYGIKSGVAIGKFGNPIVIGCKIHNMKEPGVVFIMDNGLGEFQNCEISGKKKPEIMVLDSGNPTFTKCSTPEGKDCEVSNINFSIEMFLANLLKNEDY